MGNTLYIKRRNNKRCLKMLAINKQITENFSMRTRKS